SFSQPTILPNIIWDVVLDGDVLYAIDINFPGVRIIDVSNPAAPTLASDWNIGSGDGKDVSVSNGVTAILAGSNQVILADVSVPTAPMLLGQFDSLSSHIASDFVGSLLYLAGPDGLAIYDVSDPTAPAFVGEFLSPFALEEVKVSGNYAFLTAGYDGLVVVDVSVPSAPALVSVVGLGGWSNAYDVVVTGDWALVAVYGGGVSLVDIADPTQPRFVMNYQVYGTVRDLDVVGEVAYLAADGAGVHIVDLADCPTMTSIPFIRADANADGALDISDPVLTLTWLFSGGTVPCPLALDANADASINLADAVFALATLFSMGAPPSLPYPDCGIVLDPPLPCNGFPACP
ncbi:MAG: hypothetical protein KDC38_18795, partial [Planctomycetes bacterium]|nr:hypothetical protein [Planctomycetota bacterium]